MCVCVYIYIYILGIVGKQDCWILKVYTCLHTKDTLQNFF